MSYPFLSHAQLLEPGTSQELDTLVTRLRTFLQVAHKDDGSLYLQAVPGANLAGRSAVVPYRYTTALGPPGSGQIAFNALSPYSGVTIVRIHKITRNGDDVYWGLMLTHTGPSILIQDDTDHTQYVLFQTAAEPVEFATYIEFAVTFVQQGTALSNNESVLVRFGTPAAGGGGGGPTGGLVLLEQHTASGSAALNFTTALTSAYDIYEFVLHDIVPATNAVNLYIQYSKDGGATWDAGSTKYEYAYHVYNAAGTSGHTTGGTGTSTPGLLLAGPLSNAGVGSLSTALGTIRLYDPLSTVFHKVMNGQLNFFHQANSQRYRLDINGWYYDTSAVNAVRFYMDSGNISTGTIRCYGLAK